MYEFSPDRSRVAVATKDGRLTIWNNKAEVYQQYSPSAHLSAAITTLSWCPGQRSLASRSDDDCDESSDSASTADMIAFGTSAGTLVLYSVTQGDAVTTQEVALSNIRINSVIWSNSCKSVIIGAADGMVSIFSVLSLGVSVRFSTGKDPIYSLAITENDKHIIAGSRKIQVWEVKKQSLSQTLIGHANEVGCMRCFVYKGSNFLLSAAGEDRNVSVWKLEERKKPKKAVPAFCTLSVNQGITSLDNATLNEEEMITSVNTDQGTVELYRYSLNMEKAKPFKPCHSIQVKSDSGNASGPSVPVAVSGIKDKDTLSFAYGSEVKLQIEDLKISEVKEKKHILTRAPPVVNLGAKAQKEFTKIVQPKVGDNVTYINTGIPQMGPPSAPPSPARPAKRKLDEPKKKDTVQSLEERLAVLDSSFKQGPPEVNNLSQLLVQGLRSKDTTIIRSVIDRDNPEIIENTVRSLPVKHVATLLSVLSSYIQGKGSSMSVMKWTQSVILNHSGYLISSPALQKDVLGPLKDVISARSNNYQSVLKLRGKMEMIKRQIERNKEEMQMNMKQPPLIDFEEDESDDEDEKEELHYAYQGEYDSDFLDEHLSNADSDSSDLDDDDDEDDENNVEMGDEDRMLVNGHHRDVAMQDV